ncbi:probable mitochondrial adenine nucleotide transporter BTL3 [Punica granatum]|nr:probable mitochondrial adenine nucleotide transporter BTL3 [Punica granatum]
MRGEGLLRLDGLIKSELPDPCFVPGGLFLDDSLPCSSSFVAVVSGKSRSGPKLVVGCSENLSLGALRAREGFRNGGFLSVSLSIKGSEEGCFPESTKVLGNNGEGDKLEVAVEEEQDKSKKKGRKSGALNTTKHLWAGAVAAMVSRTFVAPLERLKLEYIVRGEQKNLSELIKKIAVTQGLKGFWKGNFVNILRTAPFKAINFYSNDTYRNQLLKWSGNEETTNFERFIAGAAAGITATILCLPMDTIRTTMVAPGGEALGGVIGTFHHIVRTEGFFSLYKGLVPSIVAMAPSGAVFYGVYDILKSAYLHTPEGRKRLQHMKQEGQQLNAMEQLELGPMRTLLYGAIAGACAEATTYPFEVVRRQLQLQARTARLGAVATCMKIVEQGGVPALYAGLIPSLLQVLPSAAISYFMYECMKIVLKVESR